MIYLYHLFLINTQRRASKKQLLMRHLRSQTDALDSCQLQPDSSVSSYSEGQSLTKTYTLIHTHMHMRTQPLSRL